MVGVVPWLPTPVSVGGLVVYNNIDSSPLCTLIASTMVRLFRPLKAMLHHPILVAFQRDLLVVFLGNPLK